MNLGALSAAPLGRRLTRRSCGRALRIRRSVPTDRSSPHFGSIGAAINCYVGAQFTGASANSLRDSGYTGLAGLVRRGTSNTSIKQRISVSKLAEAFHKVSISIFLVISS